MARGLSVYRGGAAALRIPLPERSTCGDGVLHLPGGGKMDRTKGKGGHWYTELVQRARLAKEHAQVGLGVVGG